MEEYSVSIHMFSEWFGAVPKKVYKACWTPTEAENHINYLETKAVSFGLQSICSKIAGHSINILIDNTTAVACLNQMGTETVSITLATMGIVLS